MKEVLVVLGIYVILIGIAGIKIYRELKKDKKTKND